MKTEQEQTKEMAEKMERCFEKNCLLNFKWFAEALVQAGYGKVSEYKAEIERLKTENEALKNDLINSEGNLNHITTEFKQLQTNAEILAQGVRDLNHENYELTEKVKQAQVDTINTIVEYCENQKHWNELKDCKLWGGKSDDLRVFLNGIFKEVEK